MFKKMTLQLTEPICLCLEQSLQWTVQGSASGPCLCVWCDCCGTKVLVPNQEFRANFQFDQPYPGRHGSKPPPPPVEAGDVHDFVEYLKRRRTALPS